MVLPARFNLAIAISTARSSAPLIAPVVSTSTTTRGWAPTGRVQPRRAECWRAVQPHLGHVGGQFARPNLDVVRRPRLGVIINDVLVENQEAVATQRYRPVLSLDVTVFDSARPRRVRRRGDTANRLQAREFDVVMVLHPLSDRASASGFHLETGPLCVLLSRHRQACAVVRRAGIADVLDAHPGDTPIRIGAPTSGSAHPSPSPTAGKPTRSSSSTSWPFGSEPSRRWAPALSSGRADRSTPDSRHATSATHVQECPTNRSTHAGPARQHQGPRRPPGPLADQGDGSSVGRDRVPRTDSNQRLSAVFQWVSRYPPRVGLVEK